MDLVASVRKEGSRGGRSSFKWSDVKDSSHRENYLGHSLMAPVGRWQQGRDLSWYAKGDDSAEAARAEEMRRVKEAEQEAMARALGLPVPPKSTNPNMTALGGKDVEKAIRETTRENDNVGDETEGSKGIGYGGFSGAPGTAGTANQSEEMEAVGLTSREDRGERRRSHRHHDDGHRTRGRSRDRERDRDIKSRRRDYDSFRYERGQRSRSRDRDRDRARDGDRGRDRDSDQVQRRRRSTSRHEESGRRHKKHYRHGRSRSPDNRRDDSRHHDRKHRYYERR